MKDERSLKKSAVGRLNAAIRANIGLSGLLVDQKNKKFDGARMASIRAHVEQLSQCVHEYNAYMNVLLTE